VQQQIPAKFHSDRSTFGGMASVARHIN